MMWRAGIKAAFRLWGLYHRYVTGDVFWLVWLILFVRARHPGERGSLFTAHRRLKNCLHEGLVLSAADIETYLNANSARAARVSAAASKILYTADIAGPGVVEGWASLIRLHRLARDEWPYAFHLAHREYMRGKSNASKLVLLGLMAILLDRKSTRLNS